jgi:SpoVK/Ycf46/Vps4 family AAA+-type ATPase
MYRLASNQDELEELFRVYDRGVIFFDDIDLALSDRTMVKDPEEQSLFLTTLDGMKVKSNVVFVFTTNCPHEMIDRAFRRPGRIDLALSFKLPDAELRRQLVRRWHQDIRDHLVEDLVVAATDGNSFAEIEEIKNQLIMQFLNNGVWDWDRTLRQFHLGRNELNSGRRKVGFHTSEAESVRTG